MSGFQFGQWKNFALHATFDRLAGLLGAAMKGKAAMSLKLRSLAGAIGAAGLFGVGTAACSASSGEASFNDYGGASGASGSGAGGSAGTINVNGAGGGGNGGSGPRGCGGDRYKAEKRPLDIYLMFDDSISMALWWPSVTGAVDSFIGDPGSAGIGLGIQYFGSSCDPNYYANPRVPIAPLPGNAAALRASLPIPLEGTATLPALKGAIQHARSWANSHPDHKVVVLLANDGLPNGCDSNVQNVSDAAREGVSGTPSIPTYVLGMGFDLAPLEQIAQAGGTQKAFIVDTNSGAALVQAMNAIRGAALPCDYVLPNGGNVDPKKVNIDFTPQGGAPTRLPNVGDASRCGPGGGWHYDNPTAPTRAIVCPDSCGQFNADAGGQVDVVLGCDIVIF
jgi:hypothetical protein